VVYLLALTSAIFYGGGDFVGGLLSRRASTLAVVVVSQAAGLLFLAALLPTTEGSIPTGSELVWAILAGVGGGVGVALLYRALAVGTMAVVAPITACCAVAIPVIADVAAGAELKAATAAGIALALVSIVLVSQARPEEPSSLQPHAMRGIALAIGSGLAIGVFFLALARAGGDSGLWALAVARTTSVILFLALTVATKAALTMPPGLLLAAAGGGLLDMLANALYLLATRAGELSVVVTLSSLYPASTVILARVVLRERLTWLQACGVVCAMVAVMLIVWAG
jgi:drug/metabolite transporter (DMT)-like permease